MANKSSKIAPVKKSAKATTKKTATGTGTVDLTPKAIKEIKGKTVKIGENDNDKSKTTRTKKQSTSKAQTSKSKKGQEKTVDRVIPQVALAINKKFCGINLFFDSKEHKTEADSNFMKSEMKMRWNKKDLCWFVKFHEQSQLDRVIAYFGDRLWIPDNLDEQVSEVLGAMTKTTTKKTEPTISFKTLVQLD